MLCKTLIFYFYLIKKVIIKRFGIDGVELEL